MAHINAQHFKDAAKRLRAQLNGSGPIIGFTLHDKGAPFSVTYDFKESSPIEQEIADVCINAFIAHLNEVASEA